MRSILSLFLTFFFCGTMTAAEPPKTVTLADSVRAWHREHRLEVVRELAELVALPNVSADAGDVRRNARHLVALLSKRGLDAELLEVEGGSPAVFAERRSPGAERTVVFYAHYDGQPVAPERWASPPFEPTLRDAPLEDGGGVRRLEELAEVDDVDEWRLYGRSASDDKGPIVALLAALDALAAAGVEPSVHVKLFFEGEEEAGSPNLRRLLERHAERLEADAWIFCDGPVHPSRRPQVVFGVRGIVPLELTVYGPLEALHSGHYGNWAPNPISLIAELLAGLRSSEGEVLVAGFAERVRPLGEAERAAVAALPDVGAELRRELGLGRTEGGGRLAEAILRPAINLRGVRGGAVGEAAKNAVPTEARASIDVRLVPELTPGDARRLIEAHLEGEGFAVVSEEPDLEARLAHPKLVRLEWGSGYPAVRTPIDAAVSRAVLAVLDAALSEPVLRVPSLGGSLPLYLFEEVLGAPLLVVPMVNHDNAQHASNENLRLRNLWDGIEAYAALMAGLGDAWSSVEGEER